MATAAVIDPNAPPPKQKLAALAGGVGSAAGSLFSQPTAPSAVPAAASPTTASQPAAPLPPAATPAQTGVNPGGQGYNSGQVNPATVAAGAPGSTGTATGSGAPSVGSLASAFGANGQPAPAPRPGTTVGQYVTGTQPAQPSPVQIATAAFGGSPAATAPVATGAAPGTTTANAGGTTNGYNPLTSGAIGASGIGGPINTLTGGILQTQQADLSGVHAAQNADFGTAQNLSQERYDYTPGAAPSQSGVDLNTANADQTRARQQSALDALGAAASGAVPSAAELQLRQQSAKNQAANLGAARALGGRSAGGVARAATVANAGTAATTNADAAALRATEQATARQQQIAALSGVRGQDVDTAQAQAALDQARNSNNLTAQTTANAQAEAQRQALLQAQLQAMGYGSSAAGAGANASATNAAAQNAAKGGLLKTAGSALGL